MSVKRAMRYLVGLIIASVVLGVGLPLIGIPSSKFLPPPVIYSHALGKTYGRVTGKDVSPTANPFNVGDHTWIVSYQFPAHTPPPRGQTTPGPIQVYRGQARVDEQTYEAVKAGDLIPHIKYETTYPDINGIDDPSAIAFNNGRSVGPGSNILSGWLLFVLLDLLLAYLFMSLFERFGTKEDI